MTMREKIDKMEQMINEARELRDASVLAVLEDCVNALFEAHYVCEGTRDWLMDQFNDDDDEPLEEFDDFDEFHEDDAVEVLPCIDEDRVLEFFHTLRIGGVEIEDCTYLDVIRIAQENGICDLYAACSDLGDAILNMYTDDFEVARDFVVSNGCGAICTATVLDGMLSFYDSFMELE